MNIESCATDVKPPGPSGEEGDAPGAGGPWAGVEPAYREFVATPLTEEETLAEGIDTPP